MTLGSIDVNLILERLAFAGTAVFAVSGALLGLRKRLDIIGVSFIATLTGVGGGTLRDLLLGALPVSWVTNPSEIALCIGCAIVVSLVNRPLSDHRLTILLYADAAGLALFSVLGTAKADALGAHPLVSVLFGAMSATFGGILRDVICGETPILFRKEVYVTAALLGGAVFILVGDQLDYPYRAGLAILAALILRVVAMIYGWSLPFPRYANDPGRDQRKPD